MKIKYGRIIISSIIVTSYLLRGGFVAMQDEVIKFYHEENEQKYNLKEDQSLQRYIGKNQLLTNAGYIPPDLTPINSDFTANKSQKFLLRKEAAKQFADMARHFWNENQGAKLHITSAYRSAKIQEFLIKKGCSHQRCAEVGASEHQLGLAIDIGIITKKGTYIAIKKGNHYYERLKKRGADFGFHNTYQKGIDTDGQIEEGRHRRYMGSKLAKELYINNLSFGERYTITTKNL